MLNEMKKKTSSVSVAGTQIVVWAAKNIKNTSDYFSHFRTNAETKTRRKNYSTAVIVVSVIFFVLFHRSSIIIGHSNFQYVGRK